MSVHQASSRFSVKALLLVGGLAASTALSCGRDVLVGSGKQGPLDQSTGGTIGAGGNPGTGGNDPCAANATGATGGTTGAGGMAYVATGGGTGKGPTTVSCPTVSTVPGTLNACGRTTSIAFSPDGQYVATATETPRPNIHVWRLSDGALLEDLDGHGSAQNIGSYSVAFSPDGTTLATAGNANVPPGCAVGSTTNDPTEVKLWDVATGNLLPNLPTTAGSYADTAQFSPDGGRLVTGSSKIGIWNVTDGTPIATIPLFAYNARFSSDGSRIVATGISNGGVYNASDGSAIFAIPGLSEDVNDAAYSPDGSEIVTTGANGHLQFFDPNGTLLQSFVAHTVNYTSHAVWVDNDHVVSEDWGGNIKSWTRDTTNNFVASGSWSLGSQALGLAVSPDRTTLAVGGDGGFMFLSYAPTEPAVVRAP